MFLFGPDSVPAGFDAFHQVSTFQIINLLLGTQLVFLLVITAKVKKEPFRLIGADRDDAVGDISMAGDKNPADPVLEVDRSEGLHLDGNGGFGFGRREGFGQQQAFFQDNFVKLQAFIFIKIGCPVMGMPSMMHFLRF